MIIKNVKPLEVTTLDGKRIQEYLASEAKSLLAIYKQFQTLLPNPSQDAAAHKGEDGRYVESLIKEYLKKYLPQDLEVVTGFILRPAVKTGTSNKSRRNETDQHSTQLDIIVYDSYHYPVFQRFGDNVIVPPEGVIAIISVKKNFNDRDFKLEATALKAASKLCRCTNIENKLIRGPFLALVAMHSSTKKVRTSTQKWIFNEISGVYDKTKDTFENAIGLITDIEGWSIFKRRPAKKAKKAEYISFVHQAGEEHLGLQFLLTGILSVYYDPTRNSRKRPGFTAFPSGRSQDEELGAIEVCGLS